MKNAFKTDPQAGLSKNEDWQVTREIYGDAIVQEEDDHATLHVQVSLVNMLAIRCVLSETASTPGKDDSIVDESQIETDEFQVRPRFQYLVLSDLIEDAPIVEISFHYPTSDSYCYPEFVSVSPLQYPKVFPISLKESWAEWISSKKPMIY
eukprot:scaffold75561_cov55-Attheya_sp.AAC.9